MDQMIIRSDRIYFEDGVRDGFLIIEDGRFSEFRAADARVADFIDYTGFRVIPGLIDTHIHGTRGYGLMKTDTNPEAVIRGFQRGCAATGLTGVFPTIVPEMCKHVATVAAEEPDGARILGIHSEGPFLNRVGENGVKTETPVVDMALIRQIYSDCGGYLKLMAIAPEVEGSQEAIDYLRERGVVMSFAHSNCNYEEAMQAFENGLSVSTHTANVMSGIHHRNMGGLGACLLNANVYNEVICDGLHVAPVMLELMFRLKPADHWFMISDSSETAGAPQGQYRFMDFKVIVDDQGFCKTDTGRLMGSTKSVLYGVSVLATQLHLPLEQILPMAALDAAKFYGFGERKGSIALGKDADLVVIDEAYEAVATYVEGRQVYDVRKDKDFFNQDFVNKYKTD
jgi:N-acetylglucosamine-6-phosphate deacetylase